MQVKITQVMMSLNCDALVSTIKLYLLLTFNSRGMVNLTFGALLILKV